jgi:hypothetical protein
MEVGTKAQKKGEKDEAQDFFQKSYELYSIFWGLNMKLIDLGDVKKIGAEDLSIHNQEDPNQKNEIKKKNLGGQLGDLLKKVIS